MQVWKRRVAVLAAVGAGSAGLMVSSAGAQTSTSLPPTSIPATIPGAGAGQTPPTGIPGFPDFPEFPSFPTFPTSVTTTPPPTMPPSTSVTTTPPSTITFPTFTVPTIPPPTMPPSTSVTTTPPPTMPPTTIDVDDTIEEFLEDLLDRFDFDGDTFEELRSLLEQIINDF